MDEQTQNKANESEVIDNAPSLPRTKETVIQPLSPRSEIIDERPTSLTPRVDTQSLYPEPTKFADSQDLNATQQFALQSVSAQTKESDKRVCTRVKSLLIIAVLSSLAAIYGLVVALGQINKGALGLFIVVIGLIQLGMSVYLFLGKDHNTVALILKIYLVFQLLSLFMSLANPMALLINGFFVIFLFYVMSRIKSLSYY